MSARYLNERVIRVYASCDHDWIDEKTVEVRDISEGPQGEDLLTFKCPLCGEEHTSTRRG